MYKISIFNQTDHKLPENKRIVRFCKQTLRILNVPESKFCELEIVFVSPQKIASYNRLYLKHKGSTDIISFPNANPDKSGPESLGSLMICPKYLDKYSLDTFQVIAHGLLHLNGYDHILQPKIWENKLNKLNYELSKIQF